MATNQKNSELATRPKVALLRRLITAACLVLLASHPTAALDQVSMQLKWKHQFQFAGYYAALEQGFYRNAGLDVTIREGGPDIDAAEAVAGGKADFGVCSASVLREWAKGRRLVVCPEEVGPLEVRPPQLAASSLTKKIPDDREHRDRQHAYDDAAADAV